MQKNILITLGAVAFVAALGFGAYTWQKKSNDVSVSSSASTSLSSYPVQASSSNPVTITPIPVPSNSGSGLPPHPVINRAVTVPASFSAEAKAIILANIESTRAKLRANPKDLAVWIDLGLEYKAIDEYAAALEAWEYVSLMSPTNIVSYNNVGDLQHYIFKDYVRSEMNFLQAIHNDPHYVLSYLNLYDLYRLSYKQDTSKAEDILKQGIKENPKAIDLLVALATYYRGKGNVADAKIFYERAIAEATALKNDALAASLKAEVKAMEQGNVQ